MSERDKIVNFLDKQFWKHKVYECMPENESGYEYVPKEALYKIVDGLIPMIKTGFKMKKNQTPEESIANHLMEKRERGKFIPYQLCPKCNGQGAVSKPPYIPGDIGVWTSGTAASHVCNVCNGAKVIPMYNDLYDNMQYYMEYCQKNGYATPQEWVEKHKHF